LSKQVKINSSSMNSNQKSKNLQLRPHTNTHSLSLGQNPKKSWPDTVKLSLLLLLLYFI